ncbi:MAG: hypothetical protein U0470_09450 [Anaerolineae bacterium]
MRDPAQLPWADLGIDIVVRATGVFEARDGMAKHLAAGAKRVVLTAPAKDDGADVTVCMGVNEGMFDPAKHRLISNASCTTNYLASSCAPSTPRAASSGRWSRRFTPTPVRRPWWTSAPRAAAAAPPR